jgi:hypothetical protein
VRTRRDWGKVLPDSHPSKSNARVHTQRAKHASKQNNSTNIFLREKNRQVMHFHSQAKSNRSLFQNCFFRTLKTAHFWPSFSSASRPNGAVQGLVRYVLGFSNGLRVAEVDITSLWPMISRWLGEGLRGRVRKKGQRDGLGLGGRGGWQKSRRQRVRIEQFLMSEKNRLHEGGGGKY